MSAFLFVIAFIASIVCVHFCHASIESDDPKIAKRYGVYAHVLVVIAVIAKVQP